VWEGGDWKYLRIGLGISDTEGTVCSTGKIRSFPEWEGASKHEMARCCFGPEAQQSLQSANINTEKSII
jgi:hypothetical protein